MPTGDDLIGLGMPNMLAATLGNTPTTLVCTAASTQTGAAAILSHLVELTAASGSANSAIFPSGAKIGTPYFLTTTTATSAIAYVPVGHTLNATANGGVTVAQSKGAIVWQYKSKNWTYVVLA